jgi:DNA adenine methylase
VKVAAGRSSETAPSKAKPFLKWVGGKRQLLTQLEKHLPARFGTFHEPFLGGAALFFHLRATRGEFPACLSDTNLRLVRAYCGVRDDVTGVIALLRSYKHDKDFFLSLRKNAPDEGTDAEMAAWLIYLNRTAYNGLYRVNSRDVFNVPFGRYAKPNLCDAANLRACAKALQGVDIQHQDFAEAARKTRKGDLVYFDPPYVPLSASSSFTSYTAEGFEDDAQKRLRDLALRLKEKKGVHVVLSNSGAERVRKLYGNSAHFKLFDVLARRSVNATGSGRGTVTELVIVGAPA